MNFKVNVIEVVGLSLGLYQMVLAVDMLKVIAVLYQTNTAVRVIWVGCWLIVLEVLVIKLTAADLLLLFEELL